MGGRLFSMLISWDRRFADGTLAPIGAYQVVVRAFDRAGNFTQETASIYIPAPNAPTYTPAPTLPPETSSLPPAASHLTPETLHLRPTPSSPTAETSSLSPETATPTRAVVVSTFGSQPKRSQPGGLPGQSASRSSAASSPLWGAAALTAIGAATAYALEQRRKRKEEGDEGAG